MENTLYDTPEKIDVAISNFKTLLQHPGWKLVEEIVQANIAIVRDQVLTGDGSKEEMDRLRDKLQALKDVINTPKDQIHSLTSPDPLVPTADPYDKQKPVEDKKIDN